MPSLPLPPMQIFFIPWLYRSSSKDLVWLQIASDKSAVWKSLTTQAWWNVRWDDSKQVMWDSRVSACSRAKVFLYSLKKPSWKRGRRSQSWLKNVAVLRSWSLRKSIWSGGNSISRRVKNHRSPTAKFCSRKKNLHVRLQRKVAHHTTSTVSTHGL